MTSHHGTHNDLHSEQGALPGEHPGRATNPVIKVHDLAWLEFEKPDLAALGGVRARVRVHHRARAPPTSCSCAAPTPARRACSSAAGRARGIVGAAFRAADAADVAAAGRRDRARRSSKLPESLGGLAVDLTDPSGVRGAGRRRHPRAAPRCRRSRRRCSTSGTTCARANATQRPPREPARVQRLGHVVLQTTKYIETLNWYLRAPRADRQRLPVLRRAARARPDDELHPLRPRRDPDRPPHAGDDARARPTGTCTRPTRSRDLDALAAGGEYLRELGYHRSWGIGRHIQGSQIFDYWRDPDGFLVEHFADGDMFDNTLEPGWAPMTASGLAQWGPPATKDFLGVTPGPRAAAASCASMARALRDDNEFDLTRLRGLLKVATLMSITILRTADAWWVRTPDGAARIDTDATTTGELLADREPIARRRRRHRTPSTRSTPRPGLPGHRAVPGRRADDQLRLAT